jgi:hypothetical protein
VADLPRERAGLLERYGEKYPAVMDVNAKIHDAQRQTNSQGNNVRLMDRAEIPTA